MPLVTYLELASAALDYIVVGGGTSGLALAARYVRSVIGCIYAV